MNPHSEIGVHAMDGQTVSPRVREYLKAAGVDITDGATPPYWGGAFLAWLAIRGGTVPPVNAINPESWRDWGHFVAQPIPGSIAILTSGNGRGALVGIINREHAGKVYVTGAFGDTVATEVFDVGRIMECRMPPSGHQSQAAPQISAPEVRVMIEHNGGQQSMPALTDLRDPADVLRALVQRVNRLEQRLAALEQDFSTHEHNFARSDGTVIPFDDLVLRSEIKLEQH